MNFQRGREHADKRNTEGETLGFTAVHGQPIESSAREWEGVTVNKAEED